MQQIYFLEGGENMLTSIAILIPTPPPHRLPHHHHPLPTELSTAKDQHSLLVNDPDPHQDPWCLYPLQMYNSRIAFLDIEFLYQKLSIHCGFYHLLPMWLILCVHIFSRKQLWVKHELVPKLYLQYKYTCLFLRVAVFHVMVAGK